MEKSRGMHKQEQTPRKLLTINLEDIETEEDLYSDIMINGAGTG